MSRDRNRNGDRDRDRNREPSRVSSDDADGIDEQIWAWIDGELSAQEARAVEARVAADPALAERVAAIRLADAALRALPTPSPREGLQRALWQRVEAQQRQLARARWRRRALLWAAPAAAAALAILWLRTERTPIPDAGRSAPAPAPGFADRELRAQEPEFAGAAAPVDAPVGEPEESILPALPENAPAESLLPASRALAVQEPAAPRPVASTEPDLPQAAPSAGEAPELELSDEELVLALDLDMLEDLAVIENLELLESLALPLEQESEPEEEG